LRDRQPPALALGDRGQHVHGDVEVAAAVRHEGLLVEVPGDAGVVAGTDDDRAQAAAPASGVPR
jgi:hypothetical protein